jgi:SAM-dependent methyltransferase
MSKPGYIRLMRLAMGFRESKILLVANDLGLFERLFEGRSVEDLAHQLSVDSRALSVLMNAMVAMGILDKEKDRYFNQEIAERYLVKGSPDYLGDFFKFLSLCWRQWDDLAQALKPGYTPAKIYDSPEEELNFNQTFIWGMDNSAKERAERIAEVLDLSAVHHMLDLGGGAATYSIAFAKKNPQLNAVVLDLPLPLLVARENIRGHGLGDRVRTLEGSYWDLDYGSGYDLVWISQVIHALDESQGAKLVRKAAKALLPGGRLIVHDSHLNDDFTSPYHAALFSALMLALTEKGRCYAAKEIEEWMNQAGLKNVSRIELDAESDMVVGIRSEGEGI